MCSCPTQTSGLKNCPTPNTPGNTSKLLICGMLVVVVLLSLYSAIITGVYIRLRVILILFIVVLSYCCLLVTILYLSCCCFLMLCSIYLWKTKLFGKYYSRLKTNIHLHSKYTILSSSTLFSYFFVGHKGRVFWHSDVRANEGKTPYSQLSSKILKDNKTIKMRKDTATNVCSRIKVQVLSLSFLSVNLFFPVF